MTATTPTLHDKVLAAAKEAGYVQKSSRNTAQSYNYAGDEAISEKFRDAMLGQGVLVYPSAIEYESIILIPREGKDTPNVLTNIRGAFTVTDGVESFTVQSLGSGMDVGDKAGYKALTGFKKYAYRMLVMMVTGDDPEAARADEKPSSTNVVNKAETVKPSPAKEMMVTGDDPQPRSDGQPVPATQKQKDMIRGKAREVGLTADQLGDLRKKVTGKLTSKDFTNTDISAMVDAMKDPVILAAVVSGGEVVEAVAEVVAA